MFGRSGDIMLDEEDIVFFEDGDGGYNRLYPVHVLRGISLRTELHDYCREKGLGFSSPVTFGGEVCGDIIYASVTMDLFVDWLVKDGKVRRLGFRHIQFGDGTINIKNLSSLEEHPDYILGWAR